MAKVIEYYVPEKLQKCRGIGSSRSVRENHSFPCENRSLRDTEATL